MVEYIKAVNEMIELGKEAERAKQAMLENTTEETLAEAERALNAWIEAQERVKSMR